MKLFLTKYHGHPGCNSKALYYESYKGIVWPTLESAERFKFEKDKGILAFDVNVNILPEAVNESFSYTGPTGTGCGGGYYYQVLPPKENPIRAIIEEYLEFAQKL